MGDRELENESDGMGDLDADLDSEPNGDRETENDCDACGEI